MKLLARCAIMGLVLAGALWQPARGADEAEVETPAPTAPEFEQSFRIPLEGGKLRLSALLGTLLDYVGLEGRLVDGLLDTRVNVAGTAGRLTMKTIAFATRDIVTLKVQGEGASQALELRLDRLALRANRRLVQGRLMKLVEAWEPDIAAKLRAGNGMFIHAEGAKPAPLGETKLPPRVVVLVHGMDEPGWCWDTIAPALLKGGQTVCEFRYPNDQAIADSAALFAEHMTKLRGAGVKQAAVVAHSMGGLVVREALTGDDHYGGDGTGGQKYPAITRLIMLAPPNQGAAAAELQLAGEVREQVVRLFSGDGHLFGAFFDGAGEAKEDLIPGSPFIKQLNERPLPANVKFTIIASRISPFSGKQIKAMKVLLAAKAPAEALPAMAKLVDVAASLADGVGDGAVPIASTKLEGVNDHVMVEGNHSSMLHKSEDDRTALRVILDRLKD